MHSYNQEVAALAKILGGHLSARRLTCTTAESCTGGMIGAAITSVAGASEWFSGGVIAYSNDVKMRLLDVSEKTLESHGAVSAETVAAMAEGATKLLRCDCAIAVSGIAGPGGGSEEKPVGLVYFGIRGNETVTTRRFLFSGNRESIRQQATKQGLSLLIEHFSVKTPQTL